MRAVGDARAGEAWATREQAMRASAAQRERPNQDANPNANAIASQSNQSLHASIVTGKPLGIKSFCLDQPE